MPAHMDALSAIYPVDSPLHATVFQSASHGRTYHTVPLWRRIEYQLAQELSASLQEDNEKPTVKSETILGPRMQSSAGRLNLALGN